MRFRLKVPAVYFNEAVSDAAHWKSEADKYKNQALRLFNAMKRTESELGEEIYRLQCDLSFSQKVNADLALDNSALSFQLAQIRGDT